MVILSIVAYLFLAFFPTAVWLLFFLGEDKKREPTQLIIKTFFLGALSSVPVLILQIFTEGLFENYISNFFVIATILAFFEEFFKFFAAYAAIHKSPDFDEPIDPMIYMVVAGLGFATIENMFVVASVMFQQNYVFTLTAIGSAVVLRFIGATLLHVLASAVVGYFWAKGIIFEKRRQFILFGLVVATIIHSVFNTLVFEFQEINFLIPTLFLVAVSFFVFRDFENLK